MELRVLFANIFQGMIFAGSKNKNKEHLFTGWLPSKYIEYFKKFNPDICCFAEMVMDDSEGNSCMMDKMSKELNLPHYKNLPFAKSWVVEDKHYGLSVLSKFPIESYEAINLPNPKLEIVRPNGERKVMHDKSLQKIVLDIGGLKVNLFNIHSFPFQYFGRRLEEDEFSEFRKKLAKMLKSDGNATIITGDFNNKELEIEEAFKELFEDKFLKRAIKYKTTDYDTHKKDGTQIDHILCSDHFNVSKATVDKGYSDHSTLIVDLILNK